MIRELAPGLILAGVMVALMAMLIAVCAISSSSAAADAAAARRVCAAQCPAGFLIDSDVCVCLAEGCQP